MSDWDYPDGRLKPIMWHPDYRWNHIRTDILDAYARQHFTLDLLIWDIPDWKIESFVYPEEQKRVIKMQTEWTCHFCGETKKLDADGMPINQFPEMGEFWSNKLEESVMAHVDCLPEGVLEGTHEEWSMA